MINYTHLRPMASTEKKTEPAPPPVTSSPGTLYVVATPIGNLEDLTLRAIRILRGVDLIAAEDTRHTRKLLSHLGISTPTLSYYREKEQERSALVIRRLQKGENVALVSDAGTPGISDPGSVLVRHAVSANIRVEPVPGPSALSAALSVAGMVEGAFVFLGFAPSRRKLRRELLLSLRPEKRQLVFFEAPHRVDTFLQDSYEILGDREIFWCRELTKMHEELTRGTLGRVLEQCKGKKIRGESVLIISGASPRPEMSDRKIEELLRVCKKSGGKSLKSAVQELTTAHNLPRSRVYSKALEIWQE